LVRSLISTSGPKSGFSPPVPVRPFAGAPGLPVAVVPVRPFAGALGLPLVVVPVRPFAGVPGLPVEVVPVRLQYRFGRLPVRLACRWRWYLRGPSNRKFRLIGKVFFLLDGNQKCVAQGNGYPVLKIPDEYLLIPGY